MQQPSTQTGTLSFKPINAQINLDINELYKKAPYVILNNNGIQAKTSISYGGGQSHSWKETVEISASSIDRILIEIRDQNSPDQSDIIAVGELVVSKVTLVGGNYQDNLPLYFEGKQVGSILAVCQFKSQEAPIQQQQQQQQVEYAKPQQQTMNVQTPIEQQVYQAPNQNMQPQFQQQQQPQPQFIQQQQPQFIQQQQPQFQQQQQPQQFIPQQNVQQNPFQVYQQKQQQQQQQQMQFQQQPQFQQQVIYQQKPQPTVNTIQTTFKQPQTQTVQVTFQQPQTIVTLQPQPTYIPQQTITIKPATTFVQPVSYISQQPTIIQTGYVQPTIIQQPIIQPTYIQPSYKPSIIDAIFDVAHHNHHSHHHHGHHHHGHHHHGHHHHH